MYHQNSRVAVDSLAGRCLRNGNLLAVGGLAIVLCLVGGAWLLRDTFNAVEVAGYPGVFILNFIGAVSIVLPVPGLISTCALSAALNPLVLALLAATGEALGEWSGYVIGLGGHTIFDRFGWYRKLRPIGAKWMRRRGTLVLVLVSVVPNPLFDLVGIAAGSVQYPFRKFMIVVFCGKLVKSLLVTSTCYFGVTALPWVS